MNSFTPNTNRTLEDRVQSLRKGNLMSCLSSTNSSRNGTFTSYPSPIPQEQRFERKKEESISSPISTPSPRKIDLIQYETATFSLQKGSQDEQLNRKKNRSCSGCAANRSPLLNITPNRRADNMHKTPSSMSRTKVGGCNRTDKENAVEGSGTKHPTELHHYWANTGDHLERMQALFLLSNKTAGRYVETVDIGMELGLDPQRQVVVRAMHPGFAARESGLVFVGDVVRSVDFADVEGMSAQRVAALLRGRRGTTVCLTLARQGRNYLIQLLRISTSACASRPDLLEAAREALAAPSPGRSAVISVVPDYVEQVKVHPRPAKLFFAVTLVRLSSSRGVT